MQGFNVLLPQAFHATGEPIVGAVKRLKKGDKSQKDAFKVYGITDKTLTDFVEKGPEYVAKFWKKMWIEDLKSAGSSVDWRRTFITTTMTPTYSRFVEWQYNTLKKGEYVTKGTHPVVWCPTCESPTGDHDRLEGSGETTVEYTIIKFKMSSGEILPCGTLRPETLYGVTNLWINPDVEYVHADVNGEKWILSKPAAEKLKDQMKKVEITGTVMGSEIVGKSCENPLTKTKVPILPANLCDEEMATGIVMSVPAHAPYDWIGLEDIKSNKELQAKYKLDNVIESTEPISIIKVEGFGDYPAKDVCEKLGIKSQNDEEKLEKATDIVYKKEFHTGVCKDNCGRYEGMKVSEIKELVIEDLVDSGVSESIWETSGKIVCRCKTRCHVKMLENQWFLKYSDPEWKKKAMEQIDDMSFYPEDVRQQFKNTVDWLKDKACTRRSGLGTPLPWDKDWIVETLSDSTIYMAYYTLAKTIGEKGVKAEDLTDEVFDYVLLGNGDIDSVAESSGMDKDIIEELKEEFDYFYPVDMRTSGKDLVQNHLTFFIFHHVAMWEKERYPKRIGVNGYVNIGGEKMSKSKGNFISLRNVLKKHGADIMRINIVASNENMDDADWREDSIPTYRSRIKYLLELAPEIKKAKSKEMRKIDKVFESKLQETIKSSTEAYEMLKFRTATQSAFFSLTNEIKSYIERVGGIKNCNEKILKNGIETLIKLMSPIIPHTSEEMWSIIGGKGFISTAPWPEPDMKKIEKRIMMLEGTYKKTIEDINHVSKLAKGKAKHLCLYFATDDELEYFNESLDHLKKTGFEKVSLFKSTATDIYDPQDKAKRAKFGKPGIYVE